MLDCFATSNQINFIDPEDEDPTFYEEFTRVIDDAALPHADERMTDDTEVTSDNYIAMQFSIARGGEGETMHATVRIRVIDSEGQPIGKAHGNPLLDSRLSKVEYSDGNIEELSANIIAENLISQVDEEGRRQMMLGEIMDFRKTSDAIPQSAGTFTNKYGVKRRKMTT